MEQLNFCVIAKLGSGDETLLNIQQTWYQCWGSGSARFLAYRLRIWIY
jgi:hypothetical protein